MPVSPAGRHADGPPVPHPPVLPPSSDELEPRLVDQARAALSGRSRRWWVVGVLGCALGIAFAVWWGLGTAGQIAYQTIGYKVVDDRTVVVTFEVSRPSGSASTCLVQALDASFGSVGSAQVDVSRARRSTVQQTTRLRTTTRAVTGLVKSCSAG